MSSPSDRRFAESHEWHLLQDGTLTLGISQFAANELTDITYVEMLAPGETIEPGGTVGEVESVKATSEVYSAVGGVVLEVNTDLDDDPGLINQDPFGAGWLCKLQVTESGPMETLMDAATYDEKYPL